MTRHGRPSPEGTRPAPTGPPGTRTDHGQGRTGKGILFLVCIYALFFYGMYLGTGTVRAAGVEYHVPGNVYLPDTLPANADPRLVNPLNMPLIAMNLYNRPQFAGQFWVGVVAWPALVQYWSDDEGAAR